MMDAKYGANYQIFALMCLTLTSLETNYGQNESELFLAWNFGDKRSKLGNCFVFCDL